VLEKLITEDKVDAVMGPYSSAITEAVANVSEKYGTVMLAPLACYSMSLPPSRNG